IQALQPASKGFVRRMLAWMGRRAYREARNLLRSLSAGKPRSTAQMLEDAVTARDLLGAWRAKTSPDSLPVLARAVQPLADLTEALEQDLRQLSAFLAEGKALPTSLQELEAQCRALAVDKASPYRVQRVATLVSDLQALGMEPLLNEIQRKQVPPALSQRPPNRSEEHTSELQSR